MASFISKLISQIFGSSTQTDKAPPDDGGLAEFAQQLAKELEQEEKTGKRPTVSADNVLKVQHGKRGSKTYLIDTADFRKAIAQELRDSVAPVTEGILKTRCGEKGTGFMTVKALYIFHVRRNDPVEEFNAAMDIIDDIGVRLLGDRYMKGDRRVHIPVVQIAPDDLFKPNGTFDFKKAKKSVDWVRQAGTHGPANVDWETGDVNVAEGSPDWVANEVGYPDKQTGDWEDQKQVSEKKDLGDWKNQAPIENKEDRGDWEDIEHQAKKKEEKQWTEIDLPKKVKEPEKQWEDVKIVPKKEDELVATPITVTPKPREPVIDQPKMIKPAPAAPIKATNLKTLGQITLAFRPTWHASLETINAYAGCAYRRTPNGVLHGEQVYPEDHNQNDILEIDTAIAEQAALHIKQTNQLDEKNIILPFHLTSLSIELNKSPLRVLRNLDESQRQSIWIEVVGVDSSTSPNRISKSISAHGDKFGKFGIRFELGDISRSLVERSHANFLSCDVEASNVHGLQMRALDQDLPELLNMARNFKMEIFTWGLRNKQDLMFAIQEGSAMINGHALAKEIRRPGRVIHVPASKLIMH